MQAIAPSLMTTINFSRCPWMAHALGEFGVKELPGNAHNPRIVEYFSTMKTKWQFQNDESEWCSAFVNWTLEKTSIPGTDKPTARSWMRWGNPLPKDAPMYGAITVLWRGSRQGWQGHVAFYVGLEGNKILLLGGNQRGEGGGGSNQVSVRAYPRHRLLGFRWPLEYAREIVCR